MEEENSSKVCLVCGSGQAKKNYGAITCAPCRTYFRRNINLDLNINQCENNGECEINFNNRMCRVCRLKKCFSVGMNEDLFRSSHKRISTNESENKTKIVSMIKESTEFISDEELILLNTINNYDICSPISNIIEMMKNSLNNPSKIRLKIDKNNLMIIQSEFYSSIISFINLNEKFNSLSKFDRFQLIKRNIHNLTGLNQLFIYDQIQFLNDPIKKSVLLDQYGELYLDYLLKNIQKMPSDGKIIKLFLIILTFSTCSDIIHFHMNESREQHNYLSSILNLFHIQNNYVEILFKYLINNYSYENASKQFENLIKIILTQNAFLQIGLTNEKHQQIVETILNKIEQDYKIDDDQLMDSSH